MNAPALIYAVRALTWETFRQALASRVFWLLLSISGLCIVFCAGVSIHGAHALQAPGDIELYGRDGQPLTGPNPEPGQLRLLFGMIRVALFRDAEAEVHFLQAMLAKWVAGAGGLLLALIFTAGFIPDFLQPSAASVLLAKPAPRWALLLGKYLGVVLFVAFQAGVFFAGTWLALGLRTGVWLPEYLLGLPLLVVHFAVVYSFSVLLAVCTRNTVACVFGSVIFWMICFGANYARHAALALPTLAPDLPAYPRSLLAMIEFGYWVLPKPADLVILLDNAISAGSHFATLPEFVVVQELGELDPFLSLAASGLFAAGTLGIASRQLGTIDY